MIASEKAEKLKGILSALGEIHIPISKSYEVATRIVVPLCELLESEEQLAQLGEQEGVVQSE